MKSKADLKKIMLDSLSKKRHLREANNLVAYYFDSLEKIKEEKLMADIEQLLKGVPVQYVTRRAFFYNYKFIAEPGVLIPRPETEELVHWVVTDHKNREAPFNVLDIGTGSGCIIVSILKSLPMANGTAVDINPDALDLTRRNAEFLNVELELLNLDILDEQSWFQLDQYDVIVCNPPYISQDELSRMDDAVIAHEPASALFVDDNDPLQFYRTVMINGRDKLHSGGCMYFETSDLYHNELEQLAQSLSYSFEFRKDMQGKWRMMKVWAV